MKKQIIVIHGGETFDAYEKYLKSLTDLQIDFEDYRNGRAGWKNNLGKALGEGIEDINNL